MPQDATRIIPAKTWTMITTADVTTLTFQNQGEIPVYVKATVGVGAPANTLDGAVQYEPGQAEAGRLLSEIFLGTAGANRVWVFCRSATKVMVAHG